MAKRVLQLALLAGGLVGAYLVWQWMNPAPEKVIRSNLERLAKAISTKPGEGNIARVSSVNRAGGFFTGDIVINLEGIPGSPGTITGKTELQQGLLAARTRMSGDVRFDGIFISVEPSGTNAIAQFTAVGQLSGQAEAYAQNVKATFVKVEGDWLISRVDAAPRLQLDNP